MTNIGPSAYPAHLQMSPMPPAEVLKAGGSARVSDRILQRKSDDDTVVETGFYLFLFCDQTELMLSRPCHI